MMLGSDLHLPAIQDKRQTPAGVTGEPEQEADRIRHHLRTSAFALCMYTINTGTGLIATRSS